MKSIWCHYLWWPFPTDNYFDSHDSLMKSAGNSERNELAFGESKMEQGNKKKECLVVKMKKEMQYLYQL